MKNKSLLFCKYLDIALRVQTLVSEFKVELNEVDSQHGGYVNVIVLSPHLCPCSLY